MTSFLTTSAKVSTHILLLPLHSISNPFMFSTRAILTFRQCVETISNNVVCFALSFLFFPSIAIILRSLSMYKLLVNSPHTSMHACCGQMSFRLFRILCCPKFKFLEHTNPTCNFVSYEKWPFNLNGTRRPHKNYASLSPFSPSCIDFANYDSNQTFCGMIAPK